MARRPDFFPVGLCALSLLAGGCGSGELPGHYFDVSLSGAENRCTGDGTGYTETYEYRLELAGNDLVLAIGDAVFATGSLQGCTATYSSLVWSDYREDADGKDREITWQIDGSARVDVSGGSGCVEGATDWSGTETFTVLNSEHPDVSAGCTYTLDVSGAWVRDVGEDAAATPPAPTE